VTEVDHTVFHSCLVFVSSSELSISTRPLSFIVRIVISRKSCFLLLLCPYLVMRKQESCPDGSDCSKGSEHLILSHLLFCINYFCVQSKISRINTNMVM